MFRFVVGVVVGILLALAVLLSVGTVLRGGLQHADVIVALSGDTTGARAGAAASPKSAPHPDQPDLTLREFEKLRSRLPELVAAYDAHRVDEGVKTTALGLIDKERSRLEQVLRRLSADDFGRPVFDAEWGTEPWTAKDLVGHLAGWKIKTLALAERQRSSNVLPIPPDRMVYQELGIDVEAFNRDEYLARRARTASQIVEEHREVHDRLRAALGALAPDQLLAGPRVGDLRQWVAMALLIHPKTHRLHLIDAFDLTAAR